jgi:N,N'-diacetyllegionaminate synthase
MTRSYPFVILEAGINHNGDLSLALEMVRAAKRCGADAVKFQTFKAEEFVGDPTLIFEYKSQGVAVRETMLEMFKRHEFAPEAWQAIRDFCVSEGIEFLSTAQNKGDLDFLLTLGIKAVKIGSDDFNNIPLLTSYAEKGLPLILSCGMADLAEVERSLAAVRRVNTQPLTLLVCTSQYPTPPEDANLRRVTTLKREFPDVIIGFSDHTQGVQAATIAASLGAQVFEKHFTLDRNLPGPDHWFSADEAEAAAWVAAIRSTAVFLGDGKVQPSPEEVKMRALARRSVTALRPIAAGEVLSPENVGLKRPGTGLPPEQLAGVLGKRAARDIPINASLMADDVKWA